MPQVNVLPKLRPIKGPKKYHYRLKDSSSKRRRAIREGVKHEMRTKKRSAKEAAIAKKGRFNILRIYRKNRKPDECRKITSDMRYMDRLYGLGDTSQICVKTPTSTKRKPSRKRQTQRKKRKTKPKRQLSQELGQTVSKDQHIGEDN